MQLHFGLFASVSLLLLTGVSAKKKPKSDLTLLVEIQNRWKTFWNKAAVDVAVNNCKRNCGWKELKAEEGDLRTDTVDLVMRQPSFEASLAEFLALSPRGASPKDHGMHCHPSQAKDRDDYCVCAHENGDWETDCGKSKDKHNCHAFLTSMCGMEFTLESDDEDLDDFEDLELTEERLRTGGKKLPIGEVQKEESSQTEQHLLRLQNAMTNLDTERKQLYEVHAEYTKKGVSQRPLLSSIDQRIRRQKDKILRDMEEIIKRREKEVAKEQEAAALHQEKYQEKLKRLMEDDVQI